VSVPTIIDSDVGTDPDDTCVAIVVARHPALFDARLMITNDETSRWAKARFLSLVVEAAGGTIPVAAGLPSLKRRDEDLADKAGLVPERDVDRDGVTRVIEILEAHERVDYIGLGALTNLDAALARRPELASRVRLFQMGPAIANGFGRARAQYNARIDPAAFARVLSRVPAPTLIATHTTWGNWNAPAGRVPLGVYPDDELGKCLLAAERADLALYGRHLGAFVASGKDCSILHDPATLLASREPELFDLVDLEVVLDADGWLHFTRAGLVALRALAAERTGCVAAALAHWEEPTGEPIRVRLSLGADYARIRARVVELLDAKL
jgi:inosine-uridine nucleoside N-ribohydrolase